MSRSQPDKESQRALQVKGTECERRLKLKLKDNLAVEDKKER